VPTKTTGDGILKASHKSEGRNATLRWSQNSQKRDSYVAAISSSEINLDNISKSGKPSAMEEILLQNRSKESTRSVNANEISTKKIDYVLVYSEPESGKENDEEEKEKAEIREKYEENLKKQGLMVEHVTSDEQVCKPAVNLSILFS